MDSVSASYLLSIVSLLSIIPFITPINITISHSHTNPSQSPDPYQNLINLVSSSLTRAHHLKNPQTTTTATTATPLFSHSYGGYSISLSFGTPPQTLPFIMDTGSDLVWFPCTHRYICNNCSFSSSSTNIPSFIPKQSSSSKILGCLNPKCSWIHHTNQQCQDCNTNPTSRNCTQICPPYLIIYGLGSTGGIALSETLHLPNTTVPNFLVGCSVFSSYQPSGIAGFGRGPASLPSQLDLDKFSYCLLSHKLDDTSRSSSMVLDSHADYGDKTTEVAYTPFIKNPQVPEKHAFSVYYYVSLRQISVGGKGLKIPYKYLKPQSDGNGGTIIDSGTTFTFMTRDVFEPLATEFETQVKEYKRAHDVEVLSGLRPCFNVSGAKTLSFPELILHFKGGADVALPVENFFVAVEGGVVCLTVVTDGVVGQAMEAVGPAIILGNFQMQNFYVEYDLRNERFGFKQQLCK